MHGVLFIGHAKLPMGSAARDISEILAFSCIVDPKYGVILDVSDTLLTDSAKLLLRDVLIGQNLLEGLDVAVEELRMRYHGAALPAVEACIKDIQGQWRRWVEQGERSHNAP